MPTTTSEGKGSVRDAFVAKFGEADASAIEAAADGHSNGINSENKGSDPFKWALLICIGYECMSKDGYREHRGITTPWADLKPWIIEHGELATHDGDSDYLSLLAGTYNEFVGRTEEVAP